MHPKQLCLHGKQLGHDHVYEDLGNGTHKVTCKNDPLEVSIIEDHKYTVTTVNPTCETEGYILHECKLCKSSYKDNVIPAKGHNYVYRADNNISHTGTCTNDPSHKVTALHDTIDVVTAPTCEKEGYTIHTCKICGHVYRDNIVPALGHDDNIVVTKPTCDKEGYTTHTCKRCGRVVVDSKVPATGHNYTWIIDHPAEIGVAGAKHEQCVNCGAKKAAVSIPALKSNTRLLPIISSGKTTQKISWNKIPGAKYYKVYAADCGKSYKYVGTVKGTSFNRKGLKKGKYYKYYVQAVNTNGSMKKASAGSVPMTSMRMIS